MIRYMLDTNTVSHLLKGHPSVSKRLLEVPMASLCISTITEGELLFGLARRPDAKRLHQAVHEFLKRVDVLPWDHAAAECYGSTRAAMTLQGKTLAPLDLLIAAHTLSTGRVLVSNDQAFSQLAELSLEDWTI